MSWFEITRVEIQYTLYTILIVSIVFAAFIMGRRR